MHITRQPHQPIITRDSHPSLEGNVNGPSLVRAPSWVERPLGRYYLYFAHHRGRHIRLAYADDIAGPWRIHAPGVLPLDASTCVDHVASPDVHVDEDRREVRMYFHGQAFDPGQPTDGHEQLFGESSRWVGNQRTKLAISSDGLDFQARPACLGASYFRVFRWNGWTYALAMPGVFYRSRDGISGFETGPICFEPAFRHCAVLLRADTLHVLYTRAGDEPECILHSRIALADDWFSWRPSQPQRVLLPENDYEGADCPLQPSARGAVYQRVRELRDPAVFEADGRCWLLYAVAGESGIALARIEFTQGSTAL